MRRSPLDDLRLAVDCLPHRTRVAMLEGVRDSDIVVGAYTDRSGRVCPMLAAHRRGGRTDFISFAKAWDRFARVKRARPATDREIRILESLLEASLHADEQVGLAPVIAEHQSLARRRRAREAARTGRWRLPGRRAAEPEAEPVVAESPRALAEA